MISEMRDASPAGALFGECTETLVLSCLQNVMGKTYANDEKKPRSACASVGCFRFFAGEPDRELLLYRPDRFMILVPQNDRWATLIEDCFPGAVKVERYAIKKDTGFDTKRLRQYAAALPEGYTAAPIDGALYDECFKNPWTEDFVSSFAGKEQFLRLGRGIVILKEGRIAAGASSYSRYREGIEIEVDTLPEHRRRHLATAACAALILRCLKEGLYPSWDAQNMASVHLAEKLGYEFDHAYTAYEVRTE